jgi:hypothetical protein
MIIISTKGNHTMAKIAQRPIHSLQLIKAFAFGSRIAEHLKITDGFSFELNDNAVNVSYSGLQYRIPLNMCIIRYN